ncbi:phage tail protein [Chromobacterium violaceum]|uniref:phage tail protein n=1 Tax=Chromobacterium violaceum TaxID=536 RepID=UPI00385DC0EB
MGGIFGGGGTKISTSAPVVSSLRMQTSAYGRAIPLLYGKARVAANVIWYGDFISIERRTTQSAGGKGGGGGTTMESVTYTYQVAVQLGLCEGPARSVTYAWVGKKAGTIDHWNLSHFPGSYSQQPMGYMQTKHPDQALSYRGTVHVGTGVFDLGDDPTLPNMTFEVDSSFGFSNEIRDANPRDVVVDFCTNPYYGAGVPAAKFGDLKPFSDFCVANGLFISPAYTEQEQAHEILARLFRLTNSGVYFSEGKIKVVPYSDAAASGNGATFTPNLAPIYDLTDDDFLSDGDDPIHCTRVAASDAHNCIRVKFFNRANSYNEEVAEAKDQASIEQFGLRSQEIELHEIADASVARFVAQQILQRTLYVRNHYEFRLGWKFALLEPTDLITLTDPALGLDKTPVRITEIEEDEDGELLVRAEEVPLGAIGATKYPTQTSDGYSSNYNVPAGPANAPVIFEPPLSLAGAPEIWIAISGGANWGGCDVWVSDDNATYRRMGRITGKSRHGVLAAPLAGGTGVDTVNNLKVDLSVSGGALLAATQQNADDLITLCYVDGELMAYRDATLTAPNQYALGYLVRGAHGTVVGSHAAGSKFARLDQSLTKFGYDKSKVGKTLYLKFQSFNIYGGGIEDLATLTPMTYQITGASLADVTGLALEQPFTGRSCKIKWEAVEGAANYTVEVWAGTPQTLRRSVSVGDARRFEYSWEDGKADGGPWRQLVFRVRATSQTGASGNWATLAATNPVPAALTGIAVNAGYNSVFFSCNQPNESDIAGVRIWLSPNSGFVPNDDTLAYDGPDTFTTLSKLATGAALAAGTAYYLKAAAFDSFGKDGLNISSEYAVTPVSVAGGIKPGEIEATMIKAMDAAKLVGSLQDWQIAGIQAGKLLGKITADQFAGQFGSGNLAQNSSFELNGGAPYGPYNNAGMAVATSLVTGRTGGKALRIDFTGTVNNSQQGILGPALKDGWLPNTTYVLSIYARAGGGHLGRGMLPRWNIDPAYTTMLLNPPLSDSWQRYAWRITWGAMVESNKGHFHLTSDDGGAARNGWFEFDDLQVEQGDVLTQYNSFSQRIEKTEADTAGNAARISAEESARVNGDAANAQSITNMIARVGTAEASVTQLQQAQATLDGKVSSKWGVVLGATTPDGRQSLSGIQAFNDGSTSQFVITTSQLAVIPESLIPDPYFNDTAWWGGTRWDGDGWYAEDSTPGNVPNVMGVGRCVTLPAGVSSRKHVWSAPIKFSGVGQKLRLTARGRNYGNDTIYVTVRFSAQDDTSIGDLNLVFQPRSGDQTLSAQGEAPAGAARFRVIVYNISGVTLDSYCGISAIKLDVAASADMIVDGAVTTNKIAANSITADKIAANSISATHIVAGSLTGDRLAANSITGDKVLAGAISANHIDSRNLTIKDAAGNVIFGAGQNLNVGRITGLGSLATANGVAVGQVSGLGPLATKAQVAASDMAVGQLSAISANIGEISAGIMYSNDRTRYFNLDPGRSPAMMYVPGAVQINFDGSGYFARTIVSAPDVRASGVAWVNSGWIGGSGSWTTYIDTGVNLPGGWSSSSSDMFQASATIAGGNSSGGGANGYSSVEVVHGDGLNAGAANSPIDNRMYIKFTWNGAGTSGGSINITRIDWKLVRV